MEAMFGVVRVKDQWDLRSRGCSRFCVRDYNTVGTPPGNKDGAELNKA